MNNLKKNFFTIVFIIICLLIGFFAGNIYSISKGDKTFVTNDRLNELLAIEEEYSKVEFFKNIFRENFYKDISDVNFEEYIVKGLFSGLGDKYSKYYTPEEFNDLKLNMQGVFYGVGINIEPRENGTIKVISAIEGTPAQDADIHAGDLIYKVDGKPIADDASHNDAVNRIKGPEGSEVVLEVYRENKKTGKMDSLTFKLKRAKITVPAVKSHMERDQVGYLQIVEFDDGVAKAFEEHLDALLEKGAKKIVLDLRDNGGGSLSEVIEIADRIMPVGTIVSVEGPSVEREEYTSDARKLDVPFVVLVNEYSASASEILSGAIKDTGIAPLFGEKTFGKGIVQSVRSLSDGSGYTLTTSYYLTPNGNMITKEKPVEPDVFTKRVEELGYEITYNKHGIIEKDGLLEFAIDYLTGKVRP